VREMTGYVEGGERTSLFHRPHARNSIPYSATRTSAAAAQGAIYTATTYCSSRGGGGDVKPRIF
jgi:hypothetical protein